MTLPNIFQPGTDVRAAWCAIIALAIAGAWSIENRFERPISASHVTIESLYRRTVVNERTVRQVAVLRRERDAAERDLRRVSADRSLSSATATLLATMQASAKANAVTVVNLEPSNEAASASKAPAGLAAVALKLQLRGRFRNILRFVEDLPAHSTLLKIVHTELALSNRPGGSNEPDLDATVQATLYRLAPQAPSEEPRAAAR